MLRTAMGPTIGAALSDPAVIEVMVVDTDGARVIVGKLEGLPLALELAAARIASMSL